MKQQRAGRLRAQLRLWCIFYYSSSPTAPQESRQQPRAPIASLQFFPLFQFTSIPICISFRTLAGTKNTKRPKGAHSRNGAHTPSAKCRQKHFKKA